MMDGFSIGDLGKATGTKVETIRYYESVGLLPKPARTAGNYRKYSGTHRTRLGFIRRARDLGFSVDEVRQLLRLSDGRDRCCDEVDAIAKAHLADVERKIADLQALRVELNRLIRQCRRGSIAECKILDALASNGAA